MAVVSSTSGQQLFLIPPSQLSGSSNTSANNVPTTSSSYQADSIKFSNTSIIPGNYPQVTNSVPANIFPKPATTTQTTTTNQTTNNSTTTTNTSDSTTKGTLTPVSMTEAQWAVKFEEKVLKKGYQPTNEEMTKYQDIVARFKANPKVDPSIFEILSAQSSSLGAQIAAMRNAPIMADQFRALKGLPPINPGTPAPGAGSGISGVENGIKAGGTLSKFGGIGKTALRSGGLAGIVSGGFSLITNGIQAMQGKKSWSDVGGSVAADTANGAISGVTATLAGGGATLLAGALGATGIVSTLIVGLGAVGGAWLGDKIFRSTGAYDWIKDKVEGLFSGSKTSTTTTQTNSVQPTANTATQFQSAQVYRPS